MTPHIEAKKSEIAKTVLMPGDPLRAKYIAENFLEDYKLVNKVRNIYAYTGKYKGKENAEYNFRWYNYFICFTFIGTNQKIM